MRSSRRRKHPITVHVQCIGARKQHPLTNESPCDTCLPGIHTNRSDTVSKPTVYAQSQAFC